MGFYILDSDSDSDHSSWELLINATTMFIAFWYIFIDEPISFSPQVKQSVIISKKHGTYKLPHELLKDLRNRLSPLGGLSCPHKKKKDLGSMEISGKS